MQDLTHDPNFITARRAALANDPSRLIDDYQSTWAGNFLRKIGISGNKGFDALKLFRQDSFNRFWDGLPKSSQTPEMAKMIANRVNHSTGVIKTSLPVWANKVLFAPKLEASRWAWLIGDPAKATAIVSKGLRNGWDTLRPDEKAMVNQEFSQKARIAGTYYGLLAFNQAMLKLGGSSQQINFTNPSRNDFMAFKAMGYKVQPMAPMLGLVRLLANEIHAATSNSRGESRYDTMGKTAIDYGRGKLSPIGGLVADQATQADYMGRPLPFSDQKLPPRLAHQGIGKYTVGQYAAQNLTPIPVGEVAQQLQGMGMSKNQASRYIGAIVSGLVMGATGIRVSRDTSPQAASSH
jgi:hypothetical protein